MELALDANGKLVEAKKTARARGRHVPGVMNKLETAYAQELEMRRRVGLIKDFWFEGLTLKLAFDLRLTPDFLVHLANGEIELHDTKGFLEGDAEVKMKVAAERFPFRLIAVKKTAAGWEEREF